MVFAAVPIAFAFGLATFAYITLTTSTPSTRRDRPHGRGHEPSHSAGGAAVRLPRSADRDDRHGARHGRLPGEPARPCPRRPAICAGRRDVPRLGHLRRQGGRHGRGRAGAVPRDEQARRQARRSRRAAVGDRRADRDDPAEPRADHHRLGHRRVDRGAVHRRPAAGTGARGHAVRRGLAALPQRGPVAREARDLGRDRLGRS